MKKTILLLLLSVMNANVFSQTNTIKITFVGKQYNEMTLRLDTFRTKGKTIDNKTWEFSFPDSAFLQQSAMGLIAENSDSVYNIISINAVKGIDTIGMGNFGLPIDFNDSLYYHSNFVEPKSPMMGGQGTFIDDTFVLNKYFPEFDLWYTWLQSFDSKDFLAIQERWIKSDPQSHYAMAMLGKTILRYPTKDNVKTLYNLFEEEPKNSYYGLKVKAFLDATD